MDQDQSLSERMSAVPISTLIHGVVLFLLLIYGFIIRLMFLFQPMCLDETNSYLALISKPLSVGLSHYPSPNNHLLNTLLSHISCRILGPSTGIASPWMIRFPAFLAGIFVPLATYFVFRKLFNKHIGLLATALVVPSSLMIEYSTNARGYSIITLIFLLLVLVSIYVLRTGRIRLWVLFVILAAVGFYTIPTFLYFFIGLIIWMVLVAWRGPYVGPPGRFALRLALSSAAAFGLAVLLYSPVLLRSGSHVLLSNDWIKPVGTSAFLRQAPGNLYDSWTRFGDGLPVFVGLIVLLAFVIAIFTQRHLTRYKVNLALVLVVSSMTIMLVRMNLPPARVWTPFLPIYLGYAAVGLYFLARRSIELSRRRLGVSTQRAIVFFTILTLAISLAFGASVINTNSPYQQVKDEVTLTDAEQVALALKGALGKDVVVVTGFFPGLMLRYYFMKHGIPLSHIYVAPKDMGISNVLIGPGPASSTGGKVILIDAPKDGYPLALAIKYLGLDPKAADSAVKVATVGETNIFVLGL
ncbi:MAG: glycosyltransferase family 39 protein [Candidatus Geothermincolia bacterium]